MIGLPLYSAALLVSRHALRRTSDALDSAAALWPDMSVKYALNGPKTASPTIYTRLTAILALFDKRGAGHGVPHNGRICTFFDICMIGTI